MKQRLILLVLILLLSLGTIAHLAHSLEPLSSWQTRQNIHGQGTELIGMETLQGSWQILWVCTTVATLTLQVDSDQGTLRDTTPCDGQEKRTALHSFIVPP